MNELVKIEVVEGKHSVNARDLHAFLGVGRDFSNWIKGRIEKFKFVEHIDFVKSSMITSSPKLANAINYHISISMAKELSMVENNNQGRRARKYFIACEEKLKSSTVPTLPPLPQSYSEALRALAQEVEAKELAITERDHAIATKAEIGSRREATAMNTASQKAKEVKRLQIELGKSCEYASVKAVGCMMGGLCF